MNETSIKEAARNISRLLSTLLVIVVAGGILTATVAGQEGLSISEQNAKAKADARSKAKSKADAKSKSKSMSKPRGTAQARNETYLGIFTAPVPEVLAAQFPEHLPRGRGLVVQRVVDGSPAKAAGIRKHDVLVSCQRQRVESRAQLEARIRAARPGTEMRLDVLRAGSLQDLKVLLAERPAAGSQGRHAARGFAFGRVRSLMSSHGSGTPTKIAIGMDTQNLTVQVSYVDGRGKKQERKVSGSRQELAQRLQDLPPALREDVFKKIDETVALQGEKALFSLTLRPFLTVQGQARVKATLRTLRRDGRVETVTVDTAPEVVAITEHLGGLPPKVREKVAAALRRNNIPKMRVKVTRSL